MLCLGLRDVVSRQRMRIRVGKEKVLIDEVVVVRIRVQCRCVVAHGSGSRSDRGGGGEAAVFFLGEALGFFRDFWEALGFFRDCLFFGRSPGSGPRHVFPDVSLGGEDQPREVRSIDCRDSARLRETTL